MRPGSRTGPTRSATEPIADRRLGALALAALVAASVALAAPGPALVPGAAQEAPGWVLGPFGGGLGIGGGAYLAALVVAFAAYLVLSASAERLPGAVVWAAIGGLAAIFALAPPLLSLDVFSYLSYARLGAEHGLNPYQAVPADLPHDPAAQRVQDFRFAVSAYGPLFTLATYPLGLIGVPAGLWTLKAVAGASVVGVAALTARLAAVRGVSPRFAAAFVALNPLVLVHVIGGAHNDGLMALLLVAGTAAVVAGLAATAGVSLAAAVAVKASAAFAAPFAVLGSRAAPGRGHERPGPGGAGPWLRLLAAAAAAAAAIAAIGLAVFGTHLTEALGVVGENQSEPSRYGVPGTVARVGGLDLEPVRVALAAGYAVLLGWLVVWTWRGADWIRAAGWAAAGLLVATAWLVPWYLIWALPFAAVARDRALLGVVAAITALQLPTAIP